MRYIYIHKFLKVQIKKVLKAIDLWFSDIREMQKNVVEILLIPKGILLCNFQICIQGQISEN